ncbi:MAG TPA: ABC transporter permease [Gemmataceae bacterium]|nr:ABC transporter permease [Gemmataceae bacterium]
MKKTLGIFGVLVVVIGYASLREGEAFLSAYNLQNILQRAALYGILGIGVSFVIMSGGIDLSIGSVVGLVGCIAPLVLTRLLKENMAEGVAIAMTLLACLAATALIGLGHGLLITKMRLQPFVVTLCGLLVYRGVAQYIAADRTLGSSGFGDLHYIANGKVPLPFVEGFQVPVPFFLLLGLGVVAAIFLNWTIYGRYMLAVGRNEQAARFSGISTERIIISSYVLCAVIAGGLGGILFLLFQKSIQPDNHGNFYEVYAIAAAVLGGCSLRGGEGSILGVILGAALIQVLYNASNVLGFPTTLEFATIGSVILAGAIVDEVVKRIAAARRRRKADVESGSQAASRPHDDHVYRQTQQ